MCQSFWWKNFTKNWYCNNQFNIYPGILSFTTQESPFCMHRSRTVRVNIREVFDMHQRSLRWFWVLARWLGQFEFSWPIDGQLLISIKWNAWVPSHSDRLFWVKKDIKWQVEKSPREPPKVSFSGTPISDRLSPIAFWISISDGSFTHN